MCDLIDIDFLLDDNDDETTAALNRSRYRDIQSSTNAVRNEAREIDAAWNRFNIFYTRTYKSRPSFLSEKLSYRVDLQHSQRAEVEHDDTKESHAR